MRAIYVDRHIPKMLLVKALKPVWSGVVYSPLSPSVFDTLPEPELPGTRWVRVRNRLCGICATDLSLLFVDANPTIAPAALPDAGRFYLGHEVVGDIVEAGDGVTRFNVGDRVIMDTRFQGATCLSQEIEPVCRHCEVGNYALCEKASAGHGPRGVGGGWGDGFTAHETELYAVPDDLTDEQAMMVEPIAVGMHAVLQHRPPDSGRALVLGCGSVGLNVLQSLRAVCHDCHITAMARYPHQVEMARTLGADEVIEDGDGYAATARITGASLYAGAFGNKMLLGGFDVVYDCVGSPTTLENSLRWARAGGTVVMVGIRLEPLKLDLNPIWYQEVDLVGLCGHGAESWNGTIQRTYDIVIEQLLRGNLTAESFITHRFPLEQWRDAIETAVDKRSGSIKVIFDYDNSRA